MTDLIPVIQKLEELLEGTTVEIGSVVTMGYDKAIVATTDSKTREAGGLPRRSFLLAAPLLGEEEQDELVLLSVDAVAPLETDRAHNSVREEIALTRRATVDPLTQASFQNIGFSCKIVGTFFKADDGTVRFGSDMDSLWGNSMFKVYKPRGRALSLIASYGHRNPGAAPSPQESLEVGVVRYTETQRFPDPDARVFINIKDFLGKKTAVFGMTRTGKSNTIKTIAKKVFDYGHGYGQKPIGQIIFDPQGEYANVNEQDENSALSELGNEEQIRIYRIMREQERRSPKDRHLQFNLFDRDNAQLTWDLMLAELEAGISAGANYIAPLRSLFFDKPGKEADPSAWAHYNRKLLGLYALMGHARLEASFQPLRISVGKDNVDMATQLVEEIETGKKTGEVVVDTTRGARQLLAWLHKSKDSLSKSWQDDFDSGDLSTFWGQVEAMEAGRNGVVASFQRIRPLHNEHAEGDVREKIWEDLRQGRLVIVDLSRGSTRTSTALSELVVTHLVSEASKNFTAGQATIPFQIVVEEAHNLFRREGAKSQDMDPWVRLSKEAAKYQIGLVYATQEVSSVDPQILSNTSNWVVAHLNSRGETRELSKYYSFEDWADHLMKVETKGFVRLKTESSPFVVPVQIEKFVARATAHLSVVPELPEDDSMEIEL